MIDFWQTDEVVSDKAEVADIVFSITNGQKIPVDHADQLRDSICRLLPWFEHEPKCGLHLIQSAASGNGWVSPMDQLNTNPSDSEPELLISKRTKLTLRIPQHRVTSSRDLEFQSFNIDNEIIEIGRSHIRELKPSEVVLAKYVLTDSRDEDKFLDWSYQQLLDMGIQCKKLLCGRYNTLTWQGKKEVSVSLMLAGLNDKNSIKIQTYGLGTGRTSGFGIFIPHKRLGV